MAEQRSVEHVFGRKADDPENLKLLNSLRYYNDGRFRVKDWSPEIHKHEVAVRKREREDEYIKSLKNASKPVVYVQKKEVFKHTPLTRSVSPLIHNEAFFKVSGKSQKIESVAHEMLKEKSKTPELSLTIERKQKSAPLLPKRLATPDKIDRIDRKPVIDPKNELEFVKIEGIEFLPEGFIELEPVLFHDEYRFYSDRDRAKFTEEQKRLVAQRRKQYQQKDGKKMRPITLFVVKDFTNDLDRFFESWFADNKRRMTSEEIDYLAAELSVKREAVEHMQEEFLRKKKEKNANTLNLYFQGRDYGSIDKLARLPRFLQEYFYNFNKQDYSHVKSKHMDVHKQKEPKTALSKQSSNVTFRVPSKQELGATKTSKFFEDGEADPSRQGNTAQSLTMTMDQIIEGSSNVKIRDFNPDFVEGVAARTQLVSATQGTKSTAELTTLESLNELIEEFQKEKLAHTKYQNRDLPANCETRLDKNFNLMNCKITLQPPIDGQQGQQPKRQFKRKEATQ